MNPLLTNCLLFGEGVGQEQVFDDEAGVGVAFELPEGIIGFLQAGEDLLTGPDAGESGEGGEFVAVGQVNCFTVAPGE